MRKILFLALVIISFASCKKLPVRQDVVVKLKSIDNVPYNPAMFIAEIQAGETKVFNFEYASGVPLKEFKIGTDYTQDQSSYLITKPEIGSTSGTFQFSMDVDALIDDFSVNSLASKLFKVDLIDEEGSVAHFSITIKKLS